MLNFFKENKNYIIFFVILTVIFAVLFFIIKNDIYRLLSFIVYSVVGTLSFKFFSTAKAINTVKKGDINENKK
ncbi:hypothetical protein OSSY52_08700 [Tepiditoga spiralis]|uniref:Uncharacterized protein n=1 Tax=Tepiditoga spiralis TaxID=2108365 RepID=A0A7G1GAX9_9BACT|nr:hypothetical protein [Tepiditoga spiralis]BBE30729.1 hypothetical protein OSSY52_08700 [Tepiditoga spiralis]